MMVCEHEFPYKSQVEWDTEHWTAMCTWLLSEVGKFTNDWDYDHHHFYFKNQADAVMFTLKWL